MMALESNEQEFVFVEKYRPEKVGSCILPVEIKGVFQQFVDKGEVLNMLFTGPPGVGKTTVARALCNELGLEYLMINASKDGNIDTLRTTIKQFASTHSLTGDKKVVILDEADYLNAESTQPALRGFIEEYSDNCRFIMTCNYPAKILKELKSRLELIEFKIPKDERPILAKEFYSRVVSILTNEGIEYDKKVVQQLVMKHFPDFRKTLNSLQRYGMSGVIDAGILVGPGEKSFAELITALKGKDFNAMRSWVAENLDQDAPSLIRWLYDNGRDHVQEGSLPEMVVILSDYMYKHAFVADPEVNMVAMLVELSSVLEYK